MLVADRADLREQPALEALVRAATRTLREVLPHVPDAWIDHDKTKIGYEIPFTRHFYRYVPPRPLEEIQKDLRVLVSEIQAMLAEVGA